MFLSLVTVEVSRLVQVRDGTTLISRLDLVITNPSSMNILETTDLTKRFFGYTAVDDLDYQLKEGEVASLIGPNGAGKTTFFNLLTGEFSPSEGQIFLHGEDITDMPAHQRVHQGIGRVFQISNLFPGLTTFEHIRIGVHSRQGGRDGGNWFRDAYSSDEIKETVNRILETLGLQKYAAREASELSHGDKRKLEIGMALSLEPNVLLLDEPAGGLPDEEVKEIIGLIQDLSENYTILLVEHKMDVVMELSDRISVLHSGALIADGTAAEVRANDRVKEVYLGEDEIHA
jgi:branched-chain amino acid transport system ATP-binding protein